MHSLEVIIARNARAAGRAEAHAVNDNNLDRAVDIAKANPTGALDLRAYLAGFKAGRQEG